MCTEAWRAKVVCLQTFVSIKKTGKGLFSKMLNIFQMIYSKHKMTKIYLYFVPNYYVNYIIKVYQSFNKGSTCSTNKNKLAQSGK